MNSEQIEQLEKQFEKGHIKTVIKTLKASKTLIKNRRIRRHITLLASQWGQFESDCLKGVLNSEALGVRQNKLSDRTLKILQLVKEEELVKERNKKGSIWFLLLFLILGFCIYLAWNLFKSNDVEIAKTKQYPIFAKDTLDISATREISPTIKKKAPIIEPDSEVKPEEPTPIYTYELSGHIANNIADVAIFIEGNSVGVSDKNGSFNIRYLAKQHYKKLDVELKKGVYYYDTVIRISSVSKKKYKHELGLIQLKERNK